MRKLNGLRGSVVVLNLWATWCGPCKEELPRLSMLAGDYRNRNVQFVAVSLDEAKNLDAVRRFASDQRISFPVWIGASVNTLSDFGMTNVVPATVILDQRGEIVTEISGEACNDDVKTTVDWLLHDRQGSAPPVIIKRY